MIVVLTDTAKEDLENIYQYYYNIHPVFAAKLYNNILDALKILETFPGVAPMETLCVNNPKGYRSLIIIKGKIKVIYYINKNIVYVTFIRDCRQNPETLLKNFR